MSASPLNPVVTVDTAGSTREFRADALGGTVFRPTDGAEDVLVFDGVRFVLTGHHGTVTAFRPDGQLDYLQDPQGTRVTAGYDAKNHLLTLIHSDGRLLTFSTNRAGQVTSVTDPAGRKTTFKYGGGQITAATGPGGTETYAYRKRALAAITGPDKRARTFTYDKAGRLVGRAVGKAEVVTFAYGPGGGYTATDAAGIRTVLMPDIDGVIAATRTTGGPTLRLTHDGHGLVTRLESSAGQVWTVDRDADGRITATTDPLGQTVRYAYQGDTHTLAAYTDARGNTTTVGVDPLGRPDSVTHADGSAESFLYDPLGGLVGAVNRRGRLAQFLLNSDGRAVGRVLADGSRVTYAYDSRGNLTGATDATGTATLTYFPDDRLRSITYPGGKSLTFTYDAAGRRASMVDQVGFTTSYLYDAAGRLAEVRDGSGATVVKYAYDPAGRLTREDKANGTATTYAYDAAGRVRALTNLKPDGSTNSQFDYTYDAAGRTATVTTGGVTTTYGYDLAGQLLSVTTPTRTITYTYDAAGNRTAMTDNGVTTTYMVNNLNEVTQAVTGAETTTYGYDLDGNRVTVTKGTETTTYAWDDLNRLTGVASPTDTFGYAYDPLGHLLATTHNGQATTNLTDPLGLGWVAAQYDAGGLVSHYVTGLGLVGRVDAGGGTAFYDFDRLGSVVGLTDGTGSYANRYNYLPFGETTTLAAAVANPFTFVGRFGVSADGNGLFNMRARSYDPGLGGFVSDDPLGLAGGDTNVRRYVGNNPLDRNDPTGLKCNDDELNRLRDQIKQLDAEIGRVNEGIAVRVLFRTVFYGPDDELNDVPDGRAARRRLQRRLDDLIDKYNDCFKDQPDKQIAHPNLDDPTLPGGTGATARPRLGTTAPGPTTARTR